MSLFIYKLTRTREHDEYDSCVVVAKNPNKAKLIHPNSYIWDSDEEEWVDNNQNIVMCNGWVYPDDVKVELIGTATNTMKNNTVICSSFYAG